MVQVSEVGPVSSMIPAVARVHRALAASLLRRVGLFPGQELVLMELWHREGQSQAALAAALEVEPPTMAKTLARLEAGGLVARARSGQDRRSTVVTLTDRGRALEDEVRAIWAELEASSTVGLTAGECDELLRLLGKLSAAVGQARRPGPS